MSKFGKVKNIDHKESREHGGQKVMNDIDKVKTHKYLGVTVTAVQKWYWCGNWF